MAFSDEGRKVLREWAPLTDLFNKLPSRQQNGIFINEVKLTCVGVLSDFIALGTNLGVVYWFNRKTKDLQRLRCENANSSITVVKVISTVDYMLACGNQKGNVSIFQIPKSHPDNLPESLKPKNKQVERYTVADMHKGDVSALEWSKNGMKLFSGDSTGLVILTEIDFYMHISKSVELLNEAYKVIQLSYYQQNLLVSTTYRSIVCHKENKWKIAQIGRKDRKVFGNFGGLFYHNSERPNDTVLYCTRPGLRIWLSDINGYVQQTLLFKDVLSAGCPEAPIINPLSIVIRNLKPIKEPSFGVLFRFQEDLLVTYGSDVVYVLNPKDLTVVATVNNLRGILDVATNKEEIFILEEERNLIRIAYQPETFNEIKYDIPTASAFTPLSSSIRELTNKFQNCNVMSVIPPLVEYPQNTFCIHTDVTTVINAEEALESPTRQKPNTSEIKLENNDEHKRAEIYNKISKEDFDDEILYKRHTRKKHCNMSTSINSLSSNSSDDREGSISKPTIMNLSSVSIFPDLRSPNTIMNEIEHKERLLADVLNFDKIKINLEELKSKDLTDINGSDNLVPVVNGEIESKANSQSENVHKHNVLKATRNVCSKPVCSVESKKIQVRDEAAEYSELRTEILKMNNNLQTPALINIPNDWNLSKVKLSIERNASESDISLTEWELI